MHQHAKILHGDVLRAPIPTLALPLKGREPRCALGYIATAQRTPAL